MSKKILIFGGGGFIGSHLAEECANRGHTVQIYDKHVPDFLKKNFQYIEADILDQPKVFKEVYSADFVYNFAGIAGIKECTDFPVDAVKQNILGNTYILDSCTKCHTRKFIYASSLYANSQSGGIYSSTKKSCEFLIKNYPVIYVILQFGSLYGTRSGPDNTIYDFIKQALTKNKISYYGDGEEIREYVHVRDAARLSVDILEDKYENETIILTGPNSIKVKDIMYMIKEILGGDIELEFLDPADASKDRLDSHYKITPYSYNRKVPFKLHNSRTTDLGGGNIGTHKISRQMKAASQPFLMGNVQEYVMDAMFNGWDDKAHYYIEKFEKEFSKKLGRKYGVMTCNCTSAIHLVLAALGIGAGNEVIVPEITWTASAEPICWVGADPIFCDISPTTWCIDEEAFKRAISPKTKAIITVDLFGSMPNYNTIIDLCNKHGIILIEDSAESLGSTYYKIPAGKFGSASVFSFHRAKTLPIGEGGILVTDDYNLYKKAYELRNHGRIKGNESSYYIEKIGYNYTPTNLAAAFGCGQLEVLDELVKIQKEQFYYYKECLKDCKDIKGFTPTPDGVKNSFWMPGILLADRIKTSSQELSKTLNEEGVPSRPCFYPLSFLPAYRKMLKETNYPKINSTAYGLYSRIINLPSYYGLARSTILKYTDKIKEALKHEKA